MISLGTQVCGSDFPGYVGLGQCDITGYVGLGQ